MIRIILTFILVCNGILPLFSQIINSNFIAPDTVCVNQTFTIQNTSTGPIDDVYWSICSNTFIAAPQFTNLGTFGGNFNGPVYLYINKDVSNYYVFVSNNISGALTRLAFGSSLNNIPVTTNLGNLGGNMPSNAEAIYINKEGTNWYGVAVGGPIGTIAKLNFGTSLANTPTCVNMGNIGGLNYPHNLQFFTVSGTIYAYTINRSGNTITLFNFGNSINNTPTGTNLGNIGSLNLPSQFAFFNYSGNWHAFICNDGNNTLTRLDFGNSLLNAPVGTNIGNPSGMLNLPRGISISVECNKIKGLLANRGNNIIMNMNFSSGPTGPITLTSMGNPANFNFPHHVERYRIGDSSVYFVVNAWNNTLSRIDYPNCTSLPSSTLSNLPPLTFTTAGIYTVTLMNNFAAFNQSVYCKTIVAVSSNVNAASSATSVCSGATVALTANGANSYTWNPGSIIGGTVIIAPTVSAVYTVTGASGICLNSNTVAVNVNPSPTVTANSSSVLICTGSSVTLTSSGANSYTWNPGSAPGQTISTTPTVTTNYIVTGQELGGCTATAAVAVTVVTTPTLVFSPSSPTLCLGNSINLIVNGAVNYTWNPGSLTTGTIVVTPTATTIYTVEGSVGTCSGTANSTLQVFPNPTISVANSSSLCIVSGSSFIILATGATAYNWAPISATNESVIVTPSVSIIYTVTGTNAFGCPSSLTTQVNVSPNLSYSASQIEICSGKSVTLSANGALLYNWFPGNQTGNNIIVVPEVSTTYTVIGMDGICSNTKTLSIEVFQNPITDIPEIFTPNDDGKNDFFAIKTQYPTKIKLSVFNRWGNLVYHHDEYDNSWNGTSTEKMQLGSGKLPEGTYYFIIELDNCNYELVKGFVVIQY